MGIWNQGNGKSQECSKVAKGILTRTLTAEKMLIQAKRPSQEIRQALEEIKAAYTDLVSKHEAFTMYLTDEEYADAETWMDDCIRQYMTFLMLATDYTDDASEHKEHEVTVNDENNEAHSLADIDGHENEDNHSAERAVAVASAKPFILKQEKPKLPSFNGDVSKYFIFRDDFKHSVENHCNTRDSITILRLCLGPERAKFIEGISSDLKAACKYLDQNYGDRRVIFYTVSLVKIIISVTSLISLGSHLISLRKSSGHWTSITNIISLMERELTRDDLKIWACHFNSQKLDTPMHNLLSWMENEMTARPCSGATIQKAGASPRSTVDLIGSNSPVRNVDK